MITARDGTACDHSARDPDARHGPMQGTTALAPMITRLRPEPHGTVQHPVRPLARPGQRIGLLGGSFDPPHYGHVHITLAALTHFDLDAVWWLVSPGNPLKSEGPAPMADRMKAAHALIDHPRVKVTDLEAHTGTRYTAQTLRALGPMYPGVRFTWLMGADNLVQFDRWQEWRWIMENFPVGVLARPGERLGARTSRAARIFRHYRIAADRSRLLSVSDTPAWCFLNVPLVSMSSSLIRQRGEWPHY